MAHTGMQYYEVCKIKSAEINWLFFSCKSKNIAQKLWQGGIMAPARIKMVIALITFAIQKSMHIMN